MRDRDATIKPGDILVGTFGYEANIAEFYKVIKRTKSMVTLVRLASNRTSTGYSEWSETPTDITKGEPFRRKAKPSYYGLGERVQINSYLNAYVWSGKPVSCYNYH